MADIVVQACTGVPYSPAALVQSLRKLVTSNQRILWVSLSKPGTFTYFIVVITVLYCSC